MFSKRGLQETTQAYSKEEYKRERGWRHSSCKGGIKQTTIQRKWKAKRNTGVAYSKEEHRSSIQQRGTQE